MNKHTFPYLFGLIFVFLFSPQYSSAQRWIEMMEEGEDFYKIQAAFNEEWQGQEYERGKGFKQFKRWEYFMERRVYPSGRPINSGILWEEIQKVKKFNQDRQDELAKNALTWSNVGPTNWVDGTGWNPGNGRVNVVVEDPNNPNTIYIGVPAGGCWKSTDAGSTWTPLTDNLPILGVSGIAIDPTNSNIVYLGTGDGDGGNTYSIGVMKSTDGGLTWNTTGLNWTSTNNNIRRLIIDESDPNTLFVATTNGIYRTTDAGVTWNNVQSGSMQDVEIHPTNPEIVYAASDRFYRSNNGGATFTQITSGLPAPADINRFKIAVSADEPDWIYAIAGNSSGSTYNGLYRSTDQGLNFTTQSTSPNIFGYATAGDDNSGQSWYDLALAVNPSNADDVYSGGINVWNSKDGGANWTIQSQWTFPNNIGYVHADIHDLAFFGGNLYCGSDGAVSKSTDFGENWTDLTNGIAIMQFYEIAMSTTSPNKIIGGSQDNGTNLYTGSTTWTHVMGADGMDCIIDYSNDNIQYGAIQLGNINKSTNNYNSYSNILNPSDVGESGAWVTPYELDPFDPNTIYVGYNNVQKSTDGGNTWAAISSFTGGTIDVLKLAPSDNNYIYVSDNGILYKTTDAGANWSTISAGLPGLFITDIAIDPTNPDRLWVCHSEFGGNRVYYSGNGGTSWSNYSSGLPEIPANTIEYLPGSADGLYLGMDVGVYYIDGNMTDWIPCFTGLPNVIIEDIVIGCNYGKIRVGTFGRGVWEADLLCPSIVDANLRCDESGILTINGDIIEIQDLSVINNGVVDAGPFEIGFYLSTDQTFTTADIFIGSLAVSGLVAGNTTAPLDFIADVSTLSPPLPIGTYYVGFIVDYQDTVVETLDTDNADCNFSEPTLVQCNGGQFLELSILLDNYPGETTWDIVDSDGNKLYEGGGYSTQGATIIESFCLGDGCFDLTIYDSYGDGICCGFGVGSYSLSDPSGAVLASGGEFGSSETTNFCLCRDNENITGTIASDTYSVIDYISSDGIVPSSNVVTFQAGNYIDLTPDFEVTLGAEFTAEIQACANSAYLLPSTGMNAFLQSNESTIVKPFVEKNTLKSNIFKKPNSSHAILELSIPSLEDVVIEIRDINFKMMGTIAVKDFEQTGLYSLKLDQSELGEGIYFLTIKNPSSSVVQKMVVNP